MLWTWLWNLALLGINDGFERVDIFTLLYDWAKLNTLILRIESGSMPVSYIMPSGVLAAFESGFEVSSPNRGLLLLRLPEKSWAYSFPVKHISNAIIMTFLAEGMGLFYYNYECRNRSTSIPATQPLAAATQA